MIKSEKSDTKTEKAPQRIDYQTAHKSKKMQPFSLIAFIFAIITIFTMAVFGLTAGWFLYLPFLA
ncbi:MAG: hypothetical protein IPH32_18730 [Bacteroidetes bacterium]|nr:hypothetical protein [Bacteroidota bacterium]